MPRGGPGTVWPLIQNEGFDTAATSRLLGDPAATDRLVQAIREGAAAARFGGVVLDFENLAPGDRVPLTRLTALLSSGLHADHRRLGVAVIPHKPGHVNRSARAYDLLAIAGSADLLTIMAYDQHTSATLPGPVAGLDWDREILDGTLAGISPSNALMGLPLYARRWSGTASVADAYEPALVHALSTAGARADYDFDAATLVVREPDGSVTWLDNAGTLARKEALAAGRHLAGIAVWRLGFEDPAFWATLPATARPVP